MDTTKMKSNTTNANKDFQDFSKCDYTKHWSWSILFKNSMICNDLVGRKIIVEIGAANSSLDKMLINRFNYTPKCYSKLDIKDYPGVIKYDVCDGMCYEDSSVDAVVMSEVIEHIPLNKVNFVMNEIGRVLTPGGVLLLTTPTPLKSKGMELVWPDSHSHEFSLKEILTILVTTRFITKSIVPWHYRLSNKIGIYRAIESLNININIATQIYIKSLHRGPL